MSSTEDELIPFYPSQKYRDKNLAPEKMSKASIVALANAAKLAKKQGLLQPGVIDLMLANATTENRPDDYGVNRVELRASSTIPKQLGIEKEFDKEGTRQFSAPYRVPVGVNTNAQEQAINAKLVVAALTQKQDTATRILGNRAKPIDVIQYWNGVGPGSENHIRKVKEADRMLRVDPMNAKMMELWNKIVGELPNKPVKTSADTEAASAMVASILNESDSDTPEE